MLNFLDVRHVSLPAVEAFILLCSLVCVEESTVSSQSREEAFWRLWIKVTGFCSSAGVHVGDLTRRLLAWTGVGGG